MHDVPLCRLDGSHQHGFGEMFRSVCGQAYAAHPKQLSTKLAASEDSDRLMWQGQLQLNLRVSSRTVQLHVLQARYLQLELDNGFSTFVEARIAHKKDPHAPYHCLRSKSIRNSTSPSFDEKFSFELSAPRRHTRLYVELFMESNDRATEHSTTTACFLGGMSFDLGRLERSQRRSVSFNQCEAIGTGRLHSSTDASTRTGRIEDLPDLTSPMPCSNEGKRRSYCLSDVVVHSTRQSVISLDTRTQSAPAWYYLFGRPSSYRRHMVAPDILKPLRPVRANGTDELRMAVNGGVAPEPIARHRVKSSSCESVSTLSTILNGGAGGIYDGLRETNVLRFTIPQSENGHGFTLIASTAARLSGIQQPDRSTTSTPNETTTKQDTDLTQPSGPSRCSLHVHHVKPGSPADQAGLPVGSRLVEVGSEQLGAFVSLKQAVTKLREVSRNDPNGAVHIGVIPMNGSRRSTIDVPSENEANALSPPADSSSTGRRSVNTTPSAQRLNLSNSRLGTPKLTSYGSTLVCEERGIDVGDTKDPEETATASVGTPTQLTGDTLRRTGPLFKLAHPVLNLKWSDVSRVEARRQWAVAALLANVDRISNELLAGVRAYRLGIKRVVEQDEDAGPDLPLANITEIASHTWRLSRRLTESCLPYTTAIDTDLPFRRRKTEPRRLGTAVPCITTDIAGQSKDKKPTFLSRLRKSLVGSRSSASSGAPLPSAGFGKTNASDTKSTVNCEWSFKNGRHRSANRLEQLFDRPDKRLSIVEDTLQDGQLEILSSPPHGHLDTPGLLIREVLDQLLEECASYTESYLDRLRVMQGLRRRHPGLRVLLRQQAMTQGVPTLTNFLTLPQELLRQMLSNLEKVEMHTSVQHTDRPALDECLLLLREAVVGPIHSIPKHSALFAMSNSTPMVQSHPHDNLGSLNRVVSLGGSSRGSSRRTHSDEENMSPLTGPPNCNGKTRMANGECSRLLELLLHPLFSLDSRTLDPREKYNYLSDQCIIFRGSVQCSLEYVDTISVVREGFNGQAYMYLLVTTLIIVATEQDLLSTNTPSSLICDPIQLSNVCMNEYNSNMRFILKTSSGMRLTFECNTSEEKVVWRTLLQQRVTACS